MEGSVPAAFRFGGGRYEVRERLSFSSNSCVYLAQALGTGRKVAIKVASKATPSAQQSLATETMLSTEASILHRLCHPHIVRLIEGLSIPQYPWTAALVLDYVSREDLLAYVSRRGSRLSPPEAADVVRQLASAVSHMHARGIVHRDIKPDHVLVVQADPGIRATLVGFGFATAVGSDGNGDVRGVAGTLQYAAPEILSWHPSAGHGPALAYSFPVDMWSLGMLAYVLLVGCIPVDETDSGKLIGRLATFSPLLSPATAELDPPAVRFLAACLHTDPAGRLTADQALGHEWLVGGQPRRPSGVWTELAVHEEYENGTLGDGALQVTLSTLQKAPDVSLQRPSHIGPLLASGAHVVRLPPSVFDALILETMQGGDARALAQKVEECVLTAVTNSGGAVGAS